MKWNRLLFAALGIAGCDSGESSTVLTSGDLNPSTVSAATVEGPLNILAIGDSALRWNEGESTVAQLGNVLAEAGVTHTVQNNSVNGATLGCGEEGVGTADNCIPPQFESGSWTHVLVSGGGNDILESDCSVSADAILTADLQNGRLIPLLDTITETGAEILLYGYFHPGDANSPVWGCEPVFQLLERYRSLAEQTDGIWFIDGRDVITPEEPAGYADELHPSPAGSRKLAEYIAQSMNWVELND